MLIVAGVALLWTTAVFGRLGYLQLYRHRDYLLRAQRQQQRIIEISPKRGAIYDRNLHALAMSIKVDSAFAIPNEIKDKALAAQLLSGVLGISADLVESRLDSSQNFVWIERKLTSEKSEAITALNLKGVYTQAENKRFYPKADLASHVLGFVDVDEKGLGGIEYALDNQIRGKSEKIVMMADAHQKWFDGAEARRDRGANVVLTLDEKIQYIAERELAAAINKTHALAGTVVVMNPNNGELLAVANWPTFDPNAASAGTPAEFRMNRAVSALYEPGSTFKLITLAAAFDQGITNPTKFLIAKMAPLMLLATKFTTINVLACLPLRTFSRYRAMWAPSKLPNASVRQNFTITFTPSDLARPQVSTCLAKAADCCGRW